MFGLSAFAVLIRSKVILGIASKVSGVLWITTTYSWHSMSGMSSLKTNRKSTRLIRKSMQLKTRLFIFSAMAFSLASCSSGYDKSSSTTSDKYQELSVSAVYYPARNDVNPSLSNKVVFSTLLNQHGSEKIEISTFYLGIQLRQFAKKRMTAANPPIWPLSTISLRSKKMVSSFMVK